MASRFSLLSVRGFICTPSRPLATWHVRAENGRIWLGPRRTTGTNARGGDHNDGKETITR